MIFSVLGRSFGFVVVFVGLISLIPPGDAKSSFSVDEDAFSISNSPGYCFAIAAFSRWYYLMHQGEPPLRKVLDKRSQAHVARELQHFYSKNLISLQAEYCNKYHGNNNESFKRFIEGLVKGEPRIVLLMNKSPKGAVLHAVLAHSFLPDKNLIRVYDPNYIHEERFIDLDRKEYTSLDITYNAICFPEVLHYHPELVRKMESLYVSHVERRASPSVTSWRSVGDSSKRERYTRGPTR